MTHRFLWLTDLHIDHASDAQFGQLCQEIRNAAPTHVFITGDTTTSYLLRKTLNRLVNNLQTKIFFVLGNHCCWGTGIEVAQKIATDVANKVPSTVGSGLYYLSTSAPIFLDNVTAIVGHDGWYDARHGDPQPRRFLMHDWKAIKEYDSQTSFYYPTFEQDVIRISQGLADKAVGHVAKQLSQVYKHGMKKVILLTHIPPWTQSAHHRGRPNDAIAAPWYTCKIMGDFLEYQAKSHPEVDFTVLCGHTHGPADYHPLDNLHCHAGGAEYGKPRVQRDVFAQKPVDRESAEE